MPIYRSMSADHMTVDIATADCHNQVRSWRLLRSLMKFLIPTCNCTFVQEQPNHNTTATTNFKLKPSRQLSPTLSNVSNSSLSSSSSSSVITGTIFGYKRGKVKFCIQSSSNSTNNPLLLLELAVPTTLLAREMRGGSLRIALECSNTNQESLALLEMPVWRMYCNGRRVGFAVKRWPSKADVEVLRKISIVEVGAGVVSGKEIGCVDDDIMYLRGDFERVRGSSDTESFHLIDPDGNISIFFLRSQ